MADNTNLSQARAAKNDEFYTQYDDIQREINAYIEYNPNVFRGKTILLPCDDPEWSNFTKYFAFNFEQLGLKRLISTSFAVESKKYQTDYQPMLAETKNPLYKPDKPHIKGKIFIIDHDTNQNGRIDIDALQWSYLEGDGDFRSAEVTALRDEADIIITNPPFSLFREFLEWILGNSPSKLEEAGGRMSDRLPIVANASERWKNSEGDGGRVSLDVHTPPALCATSPNLGEELPCSSHSPSKLVNPSVRTPKQFLIIGNMNAITYKEVFPLIKENKLWLGSSYFHGGAAYFIGSKDLYDPKLMSSEKHAYIKDDVLYWRVNGVRWFTNIDHGRRHEPLKLMTMADNLRFNKRLRKLGWTEYPHYDNYDAIEVPYTECIPSDYEGVMGVPISFMDKYCPEQFEIVGCLVTNNPDSYSYCVPYVNGKKVYARILIRFRKEWLAKEKKGQV